MLTDGCWSPTRPSLFFTSRTDGWLEGWDIIENQRSPVMTHKVHQGAAHCVSPHPEGFLVCSGGDSGDLAMIQLSSSLVEVTKAEKVTVATMLDRETRREKILSTLKKEARLKSKAKSKMKMFMDSGMLKKVPSFGYGCKHSGHFCRRERSLPRALQSRRRTDFSNF